MGYAGDIRIRWGRDCWMALSQTRSLKAQATPFEFVPPKRQRGDSVAGFPTMVEASPCADHVLSQLPGDGSSELDRPQDICTPCALEV